MVDVDFYELLGVDRQASAREIRDGYRRVVRSAHPDVGGSSGLFRLVTQAYETLSDPQTRSEYDASLDGLTIPAAEDSKFERSTKDAGASNWDVDAEWGEATSTPDDDEASRHHGVLRFRAWAVTEAADSPLKISRIIVIVSYFLLAFLLVVMPDLLQPESADPDLYGWLTQRWWVTMIFIVVYVFFVYPEDRSLGGMGVVIFIESVGLIAWLLAYADMANVGDVLVYLCLAIVLMFKNLATILINEVGEVRYLDQA